MPRRDQAGRLADDTVDVRDDPAEPADHVVVVVSDPRLVASDGARRLNAPNQTDSGQGGEHVIHRLPRDLGQGGTHSAEKCFRVRVRMSMHRLKHRQPRARHAKVSRTQLFRVIRCGGHGTNNAPFLESVKSF